MTMAPDYIEDPYFDHAINPAAEALSGPMSQDRMGRQIISYSQYESLSKANTRMDNFVMRYMRPGGNKVYLLQASKHLKWFGDGLRPVEMLRQGKSRDLPEAPADEITAYYCRDKYPECKRFFDSKKGLDFHWRKDHKEPGFRPGE